MAFEQADVVVVAGTPLDFRLGFGAFADAAVVHLADAPDRLATHVRLAGAAAGDLRAGLRRPRRGRACRAPGTARPADWQDWIAALRDDEQARRAADEARLGSSSTPIDPAPCRMRAAASPDPRRDRGR